MDNGFVIGIAGVPVKIRRRIMQKTLELTARLLENVSIYRLSCNMDPDDARVAYEGKQ